MAALVMLSAALLLGLLLPSSIAHNVLYAGQTLYSYYSLKQGAYTFLMQDDCNLALYANNSQAMWSSETSGLGKSCFARMQTDGNFVIFDYDFNGIWESYTHGSQDKYILVLHRDGHVVIYRPIWTLPDVNYKGVVTVKRGHSDTSITAGDNSILYVGDTLNTSQSLTEGGYTFSMQSDCSLVLNDDQDQAILWTSTTNGLGDNCFAHLQTDGNLVIHNDNNQVVWSSNTAGKEDKYILFLHRDGHVSIYKPIWTRPNDTANYKDVVIVKRGHSDTSITAEVAVLATDEPTNRKIATVIKN